jgi:hypothetical protein
VSLAERGEKLLAVLVPKVVDDVDEEERVVHVVSAWARRA